MLCARMEKGYIHGEFKETKGEATEKCKADDVSWSPSDPNKILSCSVDTFINLWDVKLITGLVVLYYSVHSKKLRIHYLRVHAGAYQVKWNRLSENMFATTHEGELRIWDIREGTSPVQYIAAHLSKIHGLDWNPNSKSELATCSQDCSVKFWDINNPRQCKGSLNPGSPVWRARYTPFGQGIVTVVVPQLRRGDNSLHLWNTARSNPVHQFVGHQDVILEFQWRKQPEGSVDHQLITWSKDQSLRVWKIDSQLQKRCGHDMGEMNDSSENESSQGGRESVSQNSMHENDLETDHGNKDFQRQMSMSPDSVVFQQPQTLEQEFELMNTNIPHIQVEELDAVKRTCSVSAVSRNFNIGLRMQFPENYPCSEPPTFEFLESNLNYDIKRQLHKVMLDTALMHAKRNTSCLEPCLRQLSLALNQPYNFRPEERKTPDPEPARPFNLSWHPTKPPYNSKPSYMAWHSPSGLQDINIPFPRTSGARFSAAGYLVVFGRSHEARKGPSGTEITPKVEFPLWSLVALTASEKLKPQNNPDDELPWAQHPFGKEMIKYLFDFYMKIHDVQTLAMLVCVLWDRENAIVPPPKKEKASLLPQSTSMEFKIQEIEELL
uniref:WD repeat-containing protein 59 n=1 Tax=Magallana gigas TaxID=29159 RepID=K1R2T8_MAGGI